MSNKLEIWGNETTMNLENVLLINIQSSQYFKELFTLKSFAEVVDEIYNQVESIEPWQGLQRTPSSSFCLLYKLFTLKLTVNQMNALLNHKDSVYIRALGFLYLRYTCPPKKLWSWFEPYKFDEEEIAPRGKKGGTMQLGKWVRSLLNPEPRFCETIFPRIPVPIQREIDEKLRQAEQEEREYEEELRMEQGKQEKEVSDSSKTNKTKSSRSRSRSRDKKRKSRSRSRSRDRYSKYKKRSYSRSRSRSRSRGRYSRSRSRSRSRDRYSKYKKRSYSRSRSRSRSRDRHWRRSRSRSRDRRSPSPKRVDSSKSTKPAMSSNLNKIRELYGATTSTQLYSKQQSIGDTNTCETDVIRVGFSKKQ